MIGDGVRQGKRVLKLHYVLKLKQKFKSNICWCQMNNSAGFHWIGSINFRIQAIVHYVVTCFLFSDPSPINFLRFDRMCVYVFTLPRMKFQSQFHIRDGKLNAFKSISIEIQFTRLRVIQAPKCLFSPHCLSVLEFPTQVILAQCSGSHFSFWPLFQIKGERKKTPTNKIALNWKRTHTHTDWIVRDSHDYHIVRDSFRLCNEMT